MSGALKRDEWETVRLGDVCEVNPSKKFNVTISDDLNVGFLPMEAVSNEGDILRIDTRKYGEVKKGFSGFQDGDVLIAKITPCMENGKGALVSGMPCGIGFGSTEFHVLRPDTSKCHAKFIFHIMENPLLRQDFARKMTGSAGQRRLPKEVLQKLEIPLPPLDVQRQIADTLDKVTELIDLRKKQLEKLDELVKARFVELFGTPLLNEKGWEVKSTGDVCSVTDGSHFSPVGKEDGYPMLSVRNMRNDGFHYDDCKLVSQEDYDILVKQGCKPLKNDVLIAKDGSYFYYGFVVKEEIEQAVLSSIAILRPNLEEINPEYLCRYMLSSEIVDLVGKNYVTGAAIKRVILKGIKQIPVMLPPMELQNQFATFVEQIDKSKIIIQQSLDTLETLKKSLMQEYFG